MILRDGFDDNARFEGDRILRWRSIPANAQIVSARVTVTPIDTNVGGPFGEPITFNDGVGEFGATRTQGRATLSATAATAWVEVDFHHRRTLAGITGNFNNTTVQVDVGGGTYVEINQNGAFRTPADTSLFQLTGTSAALPALTVAKLKLTNTGASINPPGLTSMTIRSVPTNVSLRLGELPPFSTHLGEMTQTETTSDFSTVLQAALTNAKIENGFYDLPLLVHSDTIARLKVELDVEFLGQENALPDDLQEVVLPFDFSTLPQSTAAVLNVAVPPNTRVVPGQTTARVKGAFAETRIAYGPTGTVTLVAAVEVSPACSQAQIIALDKAVSAMAVDLLIRAITPTARLQLDVRKDLDGKPDDNSLLPGPVELKLDQESAKGSSWISVSLPAEFLFAKAEQNKPRYWLVLQSLEGTAAWGVGKAVPAAVNMQSTRDGGLSWRDSLAMQGSLRDQTVTAAGPFVASFRLRNLPARFEVPIELQVGVGDQAMRVKLDRFQPLGRVDFALGTELAQAFNQYLDKATPATCPEKEHLVNGDFEQWLRVGDNLTPPAPIDLSGATPTAVAVAPDGSLAYVVSTKGRQGVLLVIDVGCGTIKPEPLQLGNFLPRAIVLNPNGTCAYVAGDNGLHVIDTDTLQKLGAPLQMEVMAWALSPDGGHLYIAEMTPPAGIATASSIRVIDTSKLEQFITHGQPALQAIQEVTLLTKSLDQQELPTALAVAPDGSRLLVSIMKQDKTGEVHIFNTIELHSLGDPIVVGKEPSAIALTSDGKLVVVTNAGSSTVSVIDAVSRSVIGSISVGNYPVAVAISPDGLRAFIANRGDNTISVIDLTRRAVVKTIPVDASPTAIAVTPQGDRIFVGNNKDSLASVQVGIRLPAEWQRTSGVVSSSCLSPPFHLVAALGSNSMPTALSQVVPVAESCGYEFSFWGVAGEPETNEPPAVAEVFWLSHDCGLLRVDPVPIKVLGTSKELFTLFSALRRSPLLLHRVRLVAPVGADQAEIRFSVPSGGVAAIDLVSLVATAQAVANADFKLQEEGRLADWTLSPATAVGVAVIETNGGIRLQNGGVAMAELVQTVDAKSGQLFVLNFHGRMTTRSSAQVNPHLELRWVKSDGSPTGSPTVLEILPTSLASSVASGTVPDEATRVEIHLIVPAGTSQEVEQISLRFSSPTTVPVTFIAQSPGELTVSDVHVAFEQVDVMVPRIPHRGLCTATPPGREPGETSSDSCFCHHCESERTLVETKPIVTPAGRSAAVGRCATCGEELIRFGGPRISGAQPPLPATQPTVIRSRNRISGAVVNRTVSARETAVVIPLTAISGIGKARARRLAEIGIDSIEKLAAAAPEDVERALRGVGVPTRSAPEFIAEAKQLIASKKN